MEQRTEEWFIARRGRVTGSNVGAILGVDPNRSRDDVMRAMVRDWHRAESEFVESQPIVLGRHHEEGAIIEYEMDTGGNVESCGFFVSEKYDWLGASPDGLVGDDGLIEIKCKYRAKPSKDISEQPHYYAQVQMEMFCADKQWVDFFQWSAQGTMLERVERNQDYIDLMIPRLREFYDEYLVEREMPNAEKYLDDLRVKVDSDEAKPMIDQYFELGDMIEQATKKRKELLAAIVAVAGHKDAIICGHKLTLVKRQGAISYSTAIKELMPDADLEQWRGKETEFWRLA